MKTEDAHFSRCAKKLKRIFKNLEIIIFLALLRIKSKISKLRQRGPKIINERCTISYKLLQYLCF